MKNYLALLVLTLAPMTALPQSESDYVRVTCEGQVETVLPDRTRVDCLLDFHAIEYDWAYKWYEAVGQSLHYAMHTGRRAGIVLIIKDEDDLKYVTRAQRAILHYNLPITLWSVTGSQLNRVTE